MQASIPLRRIGIMGGSFDPIHLAHLSLAHESFIQLSLDAIWWIPTRHSPLKLQQPCADADTRATMISLAIADIPYFELKDVERDRSGLSYTIDTISQLETDYTNHQFYILLGADQVQALPRWHKIDELIRRVYFVCTARPGWSNPQEVAEFDHWPASWREKIRMIQIPQRDISSTMIRERCAKGQSIRDLVPEQVRTMIEEREMYGKRIDRKN